MNPSSGSAVCPAVLMWLMLVLKVLLQMLLLQLAIADTNVLTNASSPSSTTGGRTTRGTRGTSATTVLLLPPFSLLRYKHYCFCLLLLLLQLYDCIIKPYDSWATLPFTRLQLLCCVWWLNNISVWFYKKSA